MPLFHHNQPDTTQKGLLIASIKLPSSLGGTLPPGQIANLPDAIWRILRRHFGFNGKRRDATLDYLGMRMSRQDEDAHFLAFGVAHPTLGLAWDNRHSKCRRTFMTIGLRLERRISARQMEQLCCDHTERGRGRIASYLPRQAYAGLRNPR
jgi:hypothetical protein